MALVISTWLWGQGKYDADDVAKLREGVRRHLRQPHRFVCFTDQRFRVSDVERLPIEDMHLTKIIGCFARLRMFDPEWQQRMIWKQQEPDDRLVNIDLDTVVTGQLDPLFNRPESFVILQGGNSANPCKFGGALMMLRPGVYSDVWSDFSIEAVQKIPRHEFPDDQGWIWHKHPEAAGWPVGPASGIYVFRKPHWPMQDYLPDGTCMVTFNGWRSPKGFADKLEWIRDHWRK